MEYQYNINININNIILRKIIDNQKQRILILRTQNALPGGAGRMPAAPMCSQSGAHVVPGIVSRILIAAQGTRSTNPHTHNRQGGLGTIDKFVNQGISVSLTPCQLDPHMALPQGKRGEHIIIIY